MIEPITDREYQARALLSTAVHEAAHAVFRWRGGETLYGDAFIDTWPPFDEIIVAPDIGKPSRSPLKLSDGSTVFVDGIVAGGRRSCVPLPMARAISGAPRAWHRKYVKRAVLQSKVDIEYALAGPIAEEWNHDSGESDWDWFNAECEAECAAEYAAKWEAPAADFSCAEDVLQAVKLAAEIYPPAPSGRRKRLVRLMDDISDQIAARLRDDPRYWRTINALVDALIKHKRDQLSGEAAIKVMRRAWHSDVTAKLGRRAPRHSPHATGPGRRARRAQPIHERNLLGHPVLAIDNTRAEPAP